MKTIARQKLRAAALHLLFTALVSAASAVLIFVVWYPHPFTDIAGGIGLWKILVGVELTLGPLISLVIYNLAKPIRELVMDYTLVGLIQISALAYGVNTLYQARPILLVFVKDRFELVTQQDIHSGELATALSHKTSLAGPGVVGVRKGENSDERKELLIGTLESGRDIHLRPKYYVALDFDKLQSSTKPLAELEEGLKGTHFESYLTSVRSFDAEWGWLPTVNGIQFWTAVINVNTGEVGAFYPIDPWELKNPKVPESETINPPPERASSEPQTK